MLSQGVSDQDTGRFLISRIISEIQDVCGNVDEVKLEARLSAVLALYEVHPKKPAAGHPDTLEKVNQFIATKKLEGFSKYSINSYQIHLKHFTESVAKPIKEITANDIREYLNGFEHLKPSSLATKIWTLKSFFTWLVEEEILEINPMRKIKPPKLEKNLPKALTIEELEMLREHCQTLRERAFIEVFYSTGGRLEEIQKANKKDINWQNNSLRVTGKGNKQRDVFLSVRAAYHLRKYLNSRDDDCEALFVTERRPYRRLSKRVYQKDIKRIAERAGIEKNVHPHVLRHTFATLTLNNGAELSVVQQLLGHESPVTTQIYARVTDERKKETHKRYLIQ